MKKQDCAAVLLDRDGTINEEQGHVYRIEDFRFIPGVIPALQELGQHHIDIFIVTNQSGIAKGYYTLRDYKRLTRYMLDLLSSEGIRIKDVLYCPHHPEGVIKKYTQRCHCRKPGTGMIEDILRRYHYRPEDLVLIGDKNSDILSGKSLGLKTYLVETGYGGQEKASTEADFVFADLARCVKHILKKSWV